jgi:DNA invertase Pin-like site-specific DNA recombinase
MFAFHMSIGVYIRVSSNNQRIDSQRAEIQRWLTAHGHDLDTVQWFEDVESATVITRTGLNALQEAIFAGEVRMVVVWKLDRIARSMREGINTLSRWCECGVRVVSVTQQIDLAGTVGHLVAGVLFAIAEIELQHVKERQAAGISLAKQRGVYKGRKHGTFKARPERARELRKKGMTLSEIAQALNVDRRTVTRYLKKDSA